MCPVTIDIGSESRELPEADPSWINTQINRRRRDGQTVCVRITVRTGDVDLVVQTSSCPRRGGGGRLPNRRETEIFALWNDLGLNEAQVTGGQVVAFLKRVCELVGVHTPPGLRRAA